MALTKEKKQQIIEEYRRDEKKTLVHVKYK